MTDTVLSSEQDHLAKSRAALKHMHDEAIDWETVTAGDHVSTQYLRQQLYRRKQSLIDDPTVPLFFGRLNYDVTLGAEFDETLYIGRRHVTGELGGEPLVIDWRAPMSLPFYRASTVDPMGVRLRRRFGYQHGVLTAYEDEDLASGQATESAILQSEIERPRTGPMRDIVATIQPDQDILVRTPLEQSLCIQGAPGTGKTAVGLHRAAFLLYAHAEQLKRSGVMVIGPNDSFLCYIDDVLPALGEIDASQETLASLLSKDNDASVGVEHDRASALKGDPRMAPLLTNAIWGMITSPTEPLVTTVGHRIFRVPAHAAIQAVDGLRERGVRYEAGRAMLAQQLAHRVLLRMEAAGDSPDDRVQNAVARSKPVKDYAAAIWPKTTAKEVVWRLFSQPEFLAAAAEGLLTADEQALLLWTKPARTARSAQWSLADLVLIDEANDILNRTPSLGHVIVDEAQDHSAMALRAIGRRASADSVTLLGDLAQATTPWAATSWPEALAHLGQPQAAIHELVEGFRVPAAVIDYATRLLPIIAPGLAPARSVRKAAGQLTFVASQDSILDVVTQARAALNKEGTLGIIVPDIDMATVTSALEETRIEFGSADSPDGLATQVELIPASLAKGLEFDHVILLEPAAIVAGEHDEVTGLRRLYVCLTRAVSSLIVIHAMALPVQLT